MVGRPTFSWSDDNHLITPERFIEGNIVRGSGQRGELGFVKPVISRDFLTDHGLSYNERLRLGEDFDLYVRMLLCGARFKLSGQCGYVAVERNNSLSAVHSAEDLKSLLAANDEILSLDLTKPEARAMRRHRASIAARWHHRELLQRRRNVGALKAVAEAARTPQLLFDGVVGITRDKMRAFRPTKPHRKSETPRFLIADAGAASALLDA